MARWLIELDGQLFDLEELPKWFPSGDVFAVREREHVYLTGPAFETLRDASEVLKFAQQALDELSAVIRLLVPNYENPSIPTNIIREEDDGFRRKHHVLKAETGRIRTKGAATLSADGTFGTTRAQTLLNASRCSTHLARALALWNRDATWPQLYVALEEVEKELGAKCDAAGLCSAGERSRFTRTANSAEGAGRDARHASGTFSPPQNPMTLRHARDFIGTILEAALQR